MSHTFGIGIHNIHSRLMKYHHYLKCTCHSLQREGKRPIAKPYVNIHLQIYIFISVIIQFEEYQPQGFWSPQRYGPDLFGNQQWQHSLLEQGWLSNKVPWFQWMLSHLLQVDQFDQANSRWRGTCVRRWDKERHTRGIEYDKCRFLWRRRSRTWS